MPAENDLTYKKWRSLVNMSYGELKKFYNSKEGKQAGLSSSEASKQGISSGRESARWIMKMKTTPKAEWTPAMWKWAKKQISFISRMSGNEGELYDEKGNKTRKHTSLLIWGHNPEKYESGGDVFGEKWKSDFDYDGLLRKYEQGGIMEDGGAVNFDYELKIQPDYPYKNIANRWLEDNKKDSLKYKLAVLLLREKKDPDEILGINDSQYARLLRSLEKAKGESKNEMSWRTENYTLSDAEKWARESLRDIFYVHADTSNSLMAAELAEKQNLQSEPEPQPEIEEELLQLEDFDFDKDKYKQYLGYYNENQLLAVYSDTELSAIDVPKYNLVHGNNIYPFINISDAVSCCQTINDENVHIRYAETGKIILNKSDIIEISSGKKSISDYDLKSFEFGGIMEEELQVEDEFYAEDYIKNELSQAESVMFSNQSRLLKAMICKAKIDTAETQIANTSSAIEKNTWQEVKNIWQEYFQDIKYGTSKISFKKGGDVSDCGCTSFSQGGLAYGNSHDEGGMPLTVKSTGQKIEIEGAEGVVNKRSMQIDEKVQFEGKKLTPCEVVSKINQMGGGVKFKCEDVEEIIEKDGEY